MLNLKTVMFSLKKVELNLNTVVFNLKKVVLNLKLGFGLVEVRVI